MANLAFTLKANGRTLEAINLMQEAINKGSIKISKDHPDMLLRSIQLDMWKKEYQD